MKDKRKTEIKYCEYCQEEINLNEDYIIFQDYYSGKMKLENYFHKKCLKDNLDDNYLKNPAMNILRKANEMAMRTRKLLVEQEGGTYA